MADNNRTRLFWKVGIYYGFCFATIFAIGLTNPEWMKYLPFGGLDTLGDRMMPADDSNIVDQLLVTSRPVGLFEDAMNLFSALLGCLIVMVPLRWVYMTDGMTKSWSREVASSLLVLPMVVAAIVYIVKFSLPLAFALTGIFAGVRYRTTLKRQSDAHFTFACIAVGLASGTRSLGIALLLATFFAFTILAAPPRRDDDHAEKAPDPPQVL